MTTTTLTWGSTLAAVDKIAGCAPGTVAPPRDRELRVVELAASACRVARTVLLYRDVRVDRSSIGGAIADLMIDAIRLARMHNIAVTVHNETVEESQAATELDIFKDEYDPVAPAMYLVAECGQLCTGTTCQTPFNADLVAKLLGNLLMTVMFIANMWVSPWNNTSPPRSPRAG